MTLITRSLPTHASKADFNGDGLTDLLWRGANDTIVGWDMDRDGLIPRQGLFEPGHAGLVLKGSGDWNGDGHADLIWQNAAGAVETWSIGTDRIAFTAQLGTLPPIQGIGDFDGNGHDDLLIQRADGIWTTI